MFKQFEHNLHKHPLWTLATKSKGEASPVVEYFYCPWEEW